MQRLFSAILLGMFTAAAPALAQPSLCELHVWPVRATGAASANAFSPSSQALAASTLDMVSLFGMNPGMVVFESDNLSRAALTSPHRLLPETPACEAELILTANGVVHAAGGASFKTSFTFRDFRKGQLHILSGSATSPVAPNAGEREVATAFAANLKDIGGQVVRQTR